MDAVRIKFREGHGRRGLHPSGAKGRQVPARKGMAGETGGDREGPSPPGPINSISWEGPGGPNI